MDFLDIVKSVRSRVGMQGTGPASVTSATTAEMDLVNAVYDAWIDIQNFREDWRWMRSSVTFTTTLNTTTYSLSTIFGLSNRLKRWLVDTAYITVDGKKTDLIYLEYDSFIERTLNQTTSVTPRYFSIVPWNNSLILEKPDGIYTIQIDYQKTPQILVNNTDVPELPSSFHLAIVYLAVVKYSTAVYMPEITSQYSNQYDIMIGQIMRNQLPKKIIKVRGIA